MAETELGGLELAVERAFTEWELERERQPLVAEHAWLRMWIFIREWAFQHSLDEEAAASVLQAKLDLRLR